METAKNILPFLPTAVDCNFPVDDAYLSSLTASRPFFKATLPFIPPGINHSYKPIELKTGKASLGHTYEAKQFLANTALILASQDYATMLDWQLFAAIGQSRYHVPLVVDMIFYFQSAWRRDLDGPVKITLDALFNHLKKCAEIEARQKWNDNRVKRIIQTKETDPVRPRVELEVRCFLQKGRVQ